MKIKKCSKCKIEKEIDKFPRRSDTVLGIRGTCKSCFYTWVSNYEKRNRDKQNQYTKKRLKNNPWEKTYKNIWGRCNLKGNNGFKRYGLRGIKCRITVRQLKELWFRDKAYLMDIPSIDRIDTNGDYEINNCRYMEFYENSRRRHDKCL